MSLPRTISRFDCPGLVRCRRGRMLASRMQERGYALASSCCAATIANAITCANRDKYRHSRPYSGYNVFITNLLQTIVPWLDWSEVHTHVQELHFTRGGPCLPRSVVVLPIMFSRQSC